MPIDAIAFLSGSAEAAHLPLALLLVFGGAKLLNEVLRRAGSQGLWVRFWPASS